MVLKTWFLSKNNMYILKRNNFFFPGESEEESQIAVMVRMYLVQPKSLQECHIVFQPAQNNTILQPPQLSSLTCEALGRFQIIHLVKFRLELSSF